MVVEIGSQKVIQKTYSELIKITLGGFLIYYRARNEFYSKPFEEVQHEVYSALRFQKEQAVMGYMFSQLKDKYDGVLHTSAMTSDQKNQTDTSKHPDRVNKVQ